MRLVHPMFSEPIHFTENTIQVLTIESPKVFRQMLFNLVNQSEGESGDFVLSKNFEVLDCSDYLHVVQDYVHLQLNDRKLNNRFHIMVNEIIRERLSGKTNTITSCINDYIGLLAANLDYPTTYDVNIESVIKSLGFRLDLSTSDPLDGLIEYLSIYNDLFKNQCFILVGAKSLFGTGELCQLYKMAFYKKWKLLLIESHAIGSPLKGEVHRIIDKGLCELNLDNNYYI